MPTFSLISRLPCLKAKGYAASNTGLYIFLLINWEINKNVIFSKKKLIALRTDNWKRKDITDLKSYYLQSSYLYLFVGGKHICLHVKLRYKESKRTLIILLENKIVDSSWKKPFHHFLPSYVALFPSFEEKFTGLIRRKGTSKYLLPRRHNK